MTFVSHALSGRGHSSQRDDSETYVPEVSKARGANKSATGHLDPSTETFAIHIGGDFADPTVTVDDKGFLAANPMSDRQIAVGPVAAPLTSGGHPNSNAPGRRKEDDVNLVAHALTSEGADASEDGTGRGTPLVAIQDARGVRDKKQNGIELTEEGPMYTLDSVSQHAVAYGLRSDAQRAGQARTPSPDAAGKVRLRDPGFNVLEEQAPTLDTGAPHSVAHALTRHHQKFDSAGSKGTGPVNLVEQRMAVRRLTPVECERLQGFPDGWTDGESDSARYRMLGNAVCVPVAEWIARRIARVDAETSKSIDSDSAERLLESVFPMEGLQCLRPSTSRRSSRPTSSENVSAALARRSSCSKSSEPTCSA